VAAIIGIQSKTVNPSLKMSYVKFNHRIVNNKNRIAIKPRKIHTYTHNTIPKIYKPIKISSVSDKPFNRPKSEDVNATKIEMGSRQITIWNTDYTVILPVGFDIYQGLRLWYPELYELVIKENSFHTFQNEFCDENEYDDSMDYLDFLEWTYD
jgi:hypothetical protein